MAKALIRQADRFLGMLVLRIEARAAHCEPVAVVYQRLMRIGDKRYIQNRTDETGVDCRKSTSGGHVPIQRRGGLIPMYRKRFLVTAATLASGLVAGLAVPAHAQSLALRPACEVVVVAVTAADIQEESDGQDEIWVRVGGSWFPSYLSSTTFTEGQTRTHDELNQPKATKVGDFVKIEIHEDDPWPQANDFLGEENISCADGGTGPGGDVADIGGSGVSYVVSYFSQRVFI